MSGFLQWDFSDSFSTQIPGAIETLRADLLNVPPHLQSFSTTYLPAAVLTEDFRFPKSLTELTMPKDPAFNWTPSIALIVPSNLHTLEISVDMSSFATAHTNWVSDLPKSIINLIVKFDRRAIDFTSFSHCLPPNLEQLTFINGCNRAFTSPLGDWSCIDMNEVENGKHWPKSLTVMKLGGSLNNHFDLAKLPRRLLDLSMTVSYHVSESVLIDSKHLPPLLTELNLVCSRPSKLQLINLQCLTMLTKCRLNGNITHTEEDPLLSVSPAPSIGSALSMTSLYTSQHLTTLFVPSCHCDWFKLLPRGLEMFQVETLPGLAESPLLATHDVFKDLPTSLKALALGPTAKSAWKTDIKIPPQRLTHLTSLVLFDMTIATVTSGMIRLLPASLRRTQLLIDEWDQNDLLFLPPRLEHFPPEGFTNIPMTELLQFVPLAVLNALAVHRTQLNHNDHEVIALRIDHELQHP